MSIENLIWHACETRVALLFQAEQICEKESLDRYRALGCSMGRIFDRPRVVGNAGVSHDSQWLEAWVTSYGSWSARDRDRR
jgi:hypothetical protein